jgi:hypothetical protein
MFSWTLTWEFLPGIWISMPNFYENYKLPLEMATPIYMPNNRKRRLLSSSCPHQHLILPYFHTFANMIVVRYYSIINFIYIYSTTSDICILVWIRASKARLLLHLSRHEYINFSVTLLPLYKVRMKIVLIRN